MTIKTLAQRLRHAADVLDELIGVDQPTRQETPHTAARIRLSLPKAKRKAWTSTPAGKRKMSRIRKAWWKKHKTEKAA